MSSLSRSPRYSEAFKRRERLNEQALCVACGEKYRYSLNKLCAACMYRQKESGDPLAATVPMRDLAEELALAGRLINRNLDHQAVIQFKELFTEWVRDSLANPKVTPGGKHVTKFNPDGSDAMRVLQLCLGVYFRFHIYKDYRYRNSTSALYYQMANRAIFYFKRGLAQRERASITEKIRRDVALFLQKNLGALLAAFLEASQKQQSFIEQQKQLLEATPLEV